MSTSLINRGLPFFLRFACAPVFSALLAMLLTSFRRRAALQLEILALRHQRGVLQRSVKRPKLSTTDRILWVWLSSVWSEWRTSVFMIKAATVIAWHPRAFDSSGLGRYSMASPADRCEVALKFLPEEVAQDRIARRLQECCH